MTVTGYRASRLQVALAAAILVLPVWGCGGNNADAFRARAIQRPPEDDEEVSSPPPPPPVAAPAADPTSAAGTPQASTAGAAAAPAAAGSPSATVPNAGGQSPTSRELPTTPQGRVARSAENLERIAAALEAYQQAKTVYPAAAIIDVSRAPLLSWRVELLPYLGYEDLYRQFDRTQPWYAPQNKALLKWIPAEYQSPERGGEKTNYLAVTGTSTVIKTPRSLNKVRVEDGLMNTALVVEADDSMAVEWTRPDEYQVDLAAPKKGLGALRNGKVFLIWGGGIVGSVPLSSPDNSFKAIYTADGGEPVTMAALNQPISAEEVAATPPVAAAPNTEPSAAASSRPGGSRPSVTALPQEQLAATYRGAAATALAGGDTTSAWQWTFAAAALGGFPEQGYEWRPALRRPALGVHYAIGVTSQTRSDRRPARGGAAGPTRAFVEAATQPYGAVLLDVVQKHVVRDSLADRLPAAVEHRPQARSVGRATDPQAALTVLEPGSESTLRHEAEDIGCDVLVLFAVNENSQQTRRSLRVKLLDLARRTELYSSRRLDYSSNDRDRGAPGDEDALNTVKWELQDLMEDGLSPQPWPVQLEKRLAARRVASLGASKDPFPPRVIGEIQYYRHLGLVDTAECLAAVESLLGEPRGANLLLGSESKKKRELREWLPSISPADLVAGARRRAVKSDDR